MQNKPLHIISFDNPFPANYGGVIDVFYKIKALKELGFDIYLHCFFDTNDTIADELKQITKQLFFYKKNRNPLFMFSSTPFAVKSRNHKDILKNILAIDAPILYEGLQSSMVKNKLKNLSYKQYLRLHNLEANYFYGAYKSEKNWVKKFLYYTDYIKYKKYQDCISEFDTVFTLSVFETNYVASFSKNAKYIPVFHGNKTMQNISEYGNYAFYHGDLRLADNKKSVAFLIQIFKKIPDYKLIIASNNGEQFVKSQIADSNTISFVSIENKQHLDALLMNAHINLMYSFQQSGTKLKLVNALFKSRFCLINSNMVDDPKIISLCEMAETEQEFELKIIQLKSQPFQKLKQRNQVLDEVLNDLNNAKKIRDIII